jgi:hypothetical protein
MRTATRLSRSLSMTLISQRSRPLLVLLRSIAWKD